MQAEVSRSFKMSRQLEEHGIKFLINVNVININNVNYVNKGKSWDLCLLSNMPQTI